ncbi:hypothetical protein [Streptomyces sp. NPDC050504]|uniref:hypothetical protein n=1 Tax=Streptomyces sp. NPDC050504 TaxID=3365618 RepID=UPI003791292C
MAYGPAYGIRTSLAALALVTAGAAALGSTGARAVGGGLDAAPAPFVEPRIDLRVLVVDDGGHAVRAVLEELRATGVPHTAVALADPDRPRMDAPGFLFDAPGGRPRAKFQGVVVPNESALDPAELTAVAAYEKRFGIRQVDAYTWAPTDGGGWAGTLDGVRARVTDAGRAGPFGYLKGTVEFEDNSPQVPESYGYLTVRPPAGFTTYVDAPVPGSAARGPLVGELDRDGRRSLLVTFGYNQHQRQFRLLARGIVEWLTQGVHIGRSRHYFAVHVDDVFAPDERWDTALDATTGERPIRMTADDARHAARWQRERGFTLDLAYNGGYAGSDPAADPLTAQLVADRARYRWINHTFTHAYLGCVQNTATVPWSCAKDATGAVRWPTRAQIAAQIRDNHAWAVRQGLDVDRAELVTGEHSGLKTLPQQPADNPNLAGALTDTGVRWIASDNSREPAQRPVGPARTVPRHPMNVYYNVGTAAEMTDEYNWIYTSRADGGSGTCENNPAASCLPAPLDPATGYAEHIVPLEVRTALAHVLAGDPRPHYAHQSNLAEERILYPVVDRVLAEYRALFTADTPLINPRQSAIGTELHRRALAEGRVSGYRVGDTLVVTAPRGVLAPLTVPAATAFGAPYAGARSGWTPSIKLRLPTA